MTTTPLIAMSNSFWDGVTDLQYAKQQLLQAQNTIHESDQIKRPASLETRLLLVIAQSLLALALRDRGEEKPT